MRNGVRGDGVVAGPTSGSSSRVTPRVMAGLMPALKLRLSVTLRRAPRRAGRALTPALILASILVLFAQSPARAQMPDLSQMSGRSLPSPELPVGTVSVRVIRGAITNNVPNQDVALEGQGQPLSSRTDASGRAMFPGLTPGSAWRAIVTVDGERLESLPFVVPSSGGLRVILAAGVGAGHGGAPGASSAPPGAQGAPPSPGGSPSVSPSVSPTPGARSSAGAGAGATPPPQAPIPGEVLLGSQTRFVIELAEGSLEVYGLLPLGNTHETPVMPPQPIVFQAPDGAKSLTVLEGSTPQAKIVDGNKVVVSGPFAPGETPLQIAYRIPYDGDTVTFAQALPLAMRQTTVVARKLGNLRLEVPGVRSQREARLEGRTYVIVNADRVDANGQLLVRLRGLPHRSEWPRYAALLLALVITIAGVWIAVQPDRGAQDDTDTRALRARRAGLFEQLVNVERRLTGRARDKGHDKDRDNGHDTGPLEPEDAPALRERRETLIAEIEDLDDVLASLSSAARDRASRARSGQVAADASKAAAFADGGTGVRDPREPRGDTAAPRPAVR